MKSSKVFKVILGAIMGIMAPSCSDDVSVTPKTDLTSSEGLVIRIPNLSNSAAFAYTRTDGNAPTRVQIEATQTEAAIDNIYLVAVNADNSSISVIALTNSKTPSTSSGEYTDYGPVKLQPGDYNFYLLANLDHYIDGTVSGKENLTDIENLVLNFKGESNTSKLKLGHLPMCCLPKDIKTSPSDDSKLGETGKITITEGGTGQAIYADLTFLCSKVRYTLLFDLAEEGNTFTSNDVDFTGVKATQVREETAIHNGTPSPTLFSVESDIDFNMAGYPTDDLKTAYLDIENQEDSPKMLVPVESWTNENERAWQGVVYLPENKPGESTGATKLNFEGQGEEMLDDYSLTLFWNNHGIERGHFYDLVGIIKTADTQDLQTTLRVVNWDTKSLTYELHGPYELTVASTKLEMTSGQTVELPYSSNAEVTGVSPKIYWNTDGSGNISFVWPDESGNISGDYQKSAALFDIDLASKPGVALITTGEDIPYDVLNALIQNSDNGFNKINYFHLQVGNLLKKIEVMSLEVKKYLNINPLEILIDVREYITSGIDSNEIDILIDCNVTDEIIVSGDVASLINNNGILWINALTGANLSTSKLTITEGSGTLRLNMKGFFDGETFWKNEKVFTINFSAGDEPDLNKSLTIKVKPFTTDYVFHFRCVSGDYPWKSPHVYAYQCLELPWDLDGEYEKYAGHTVGYDFGSNGQSSALEYLFSNNVSFRGWQGYGGTVPLDLEGTYFIDGFVHVGGKQVSGSTLFNPENNSEYYNYETDFNSVHAHNQLNWWCETCRKYQTASDYNRENGGNYGSHAFAGVAMEKESGENEGWYKYTLSGVATPGKALIIFFDGHVWEDLNGRTEKNYRYPCKDNGEDTAGISLFNYPDHEAWFVFDGNGENRSQNFKDDKPAFYRFYWPYEFGQDIHFYSQAVNNPFTTWPNGKGSYDSDLGYYYLDIQEKDIIDGNLAYTFKKDGNWEYKTQSSTFKNNFKMSSNGNYCAYINVFRDELKPGMPVANPQKIFNGQETITLNFSNPNNRTHIYFFGTNNDIGEGWPGRKLDYATSYVFKVTLDMIGQNWFRFILNNGSEGNGNQDDYIQVNYDDLVPVTGKTNEFTVNK